jgi:hypothetical protein
MSRLQQSCCCSALACIIRCLMVACNVELWQLVKSCRVLKLLSEDPANYPDAPREGIRRILEEVTGRPHPR